jgi:hypothetical protein
MPYYTIENASALTDFSLTDCAGNSVGFETYLAALGLDNKKIPVKSFISRNYLGTNFDKYKILKYSLGGSTLVSEGNYAWMGGAEIPFTTEGIPSNKLLLNGTRPLFKKVLSTDSNKLNDPDKYYLILRTADALTAYEGTYWNSDYENSGVAYFKNFDAKGVWSISKSSFIEGVVPLRMFICAVGGGGGGYHGAIARPSPGGGGGGAVFGIWDFLTYPAMVVRIGAGGEGGTAKYAPRDGTSTYVHGIKHLSELSQQSDGTNYFWASTSNVKGGILVGALGQAAYGVGTSANGGLGGLFTGTKDAEGNPSNFFYLSSNSEPFWGINGGRGGKTGCSGESLEVNGANDYLCFSNSTVISENNLAKDYQHLHINSAGGLATGDTNAEGGGGGASALGTGGAGGGVMSSTDLTGRNGKNGGGGGGGGKDADGGAGGNGAIALYY